MACVSRVQKASISCSDEVMCRQLTQTTIHEWAQIHVSLKFARTTLYVFCTYNNNCNISQYNSSSVATWWEVRRAHILTFRSWRHDTHVVCVSHVSMKSVGERETANSAVLLMRKRNDEHG